MKIIDNNGNKGAQTDNLDPKHVVILLYPEGFQHDLGAWGAKTVSNPTVFDLSDNGKDAPTVIYNKLLEHVKKYGTIDEIVIGGHGAGAQAMMGSPQFNYIPTATLLDILDLIQKELDYKVTNRIVFSGCSVFSELPEKIIQYYRDFAYAHKMEIVGATSWTGSTAFGRYVQFTPMGEVVRDKLDSKYNPLADVHYDPSWVQYHLGKTQEEGEKAQIEDIVSDVRTLVNMQDIPPSIHFDPRYEMRDNLYKKDKAAERISVLMAPNEASAVMVDATGVIKSFGGIKLHPITEEEKQSELVQLM